MLRRLRRGAPPFPATRRPGAFGYEPCNGNFRYESKKAFDVRDRRRPKTHSDEINRGRRMADRRLAVFFACRAPSPEVVETNGRETRPSARELTAQWCRVREPPRVNCFRAITSAGKSLTAVAAGRDGLLHKNTVRVAKALNSSALRSDSRRTSSPARRFALRSARRLDHNPTTRRPHRSANSRHSFIGGSPRSAEWGRRVRPPHSTPRRRPRRRAQVATILMAEEIEVNPRLRLRPSGQRAPAVKASA